MHRINIDASTRPREPESSDGAGVKLFTAEMREMGAEYQEFHALFTVGE